MVHPIPRLAHQGNLIPTGGGNAKRCISDLFHRVREVRGADIINNEACALAFSPYVALVSVNAAIGDVVNLGVRILYTKSIKNRINLGTAGV